MLISEKWLNVLCPQMNCLEFKKIVREFVRSTIAFTVCLTIFSNKLFIYLYTVHANSKCSYNAAVRFIVFALPMHIRL